MLIYLIRNQITGKIYIGQTTTTLPERWTAHIKSAKYLRSRTPFHCAIRRYGSNNWDLEVVCKADDQEQLDALEIATIAALRTQDSRYGYNLLDGGSQSPTVFPEVRAKIAVTLTGRKRTKESIAKQLASRAGYKHSEATKQKIAESNRRTKASGLSAETIQKISEAAKRRDPACYKRTPEQCAAISARMMGHKHSEETRRKIGEKSKLKVMSSETRAKISAASKAHRANRFWSTRKKEGSSLTPL